MVNGWLEAAPGEPDAPTGSAPLAAGITAPEAAACGPAGAGGPGTGGAPKPAFWLQATQTAATAHKAAATDKARVGIGARYSA